MTIPNRSQQQQQPRSAPGSVPLLRSGSTVSNFSGMTTESIEARLLSQATSTATMAARSVLEAGGSEATALKTAKAAAKSILNMEDDSHTLTSSGFHVFRRRRSRRQAEVVASMALVSATNAVRHNTEWDILTGSQTSRDLQARTLQTQHDMRTLASPPFPRTRSFASPVGVATPTGSQQDSSKSSISKVPPESPSLFSLGTSSMGRPPAVPNTPKPPRSVQTEPTTVEKLSAANSTKGSNGGNSIFTDEDSDKPTSIRVPAATSSVVESSPSPEDNNNSAKDTPRRGYLAKIMAEQLSSEDPIYYQDHDSNLRGRNSKREQHVSNVAHEERPRGLDLQISSESESLGDSLYTRSTTDNENDKSHKNDKHAEKNDTFISKPFDMLSFGNFFACGGGRQEDIVHDLESEDDKEHSLTDGDHDDHDEDEDDDDDESGSSMSSINSAAILRELNHSSDIDDPIPQRRADSSARKNAQVVSESQAVEKETITHQNRDDSSSRIVSIESRQDLEVAEVTDLAENVSTAEPELVMVKTTSDIPGPPAVAATPSNGKRSLRMGWKLPGRKNNRQKSEIA